VFIDGVNKLQRLLHILAVHQPHALELGLRSRFESFYNPPILLTLSFPYCIDHDLYIVRVCVWGDAVT